LVLVPVVLQQQQQSLEETFAVLQGVSLERRYEDWNTWQRRWDRVVFIFLWLGIVVAGAIHDSFADERKPAIQSVGDIVQLVLIALCSGVIMGLAYGTVFICRSLRIMLDAFCCDVVLTPLEEVAHTWNLTQAVLRKASLSVESSLLVLCLVLAFTVPLLLVDSGVLGEGGAPIPSLIPAMLVSSGVLYVLFLAATVSEQCTQVPALVNAISFGDCSEHERQQTVLYITHSAAGFYVFGTRLTFAMVIKLVYFWCIVVVGLLSRLVSVGGIDR